MVGIKRPQHSNSEAEQEIECHTVANVLMLLSHGSMEKKPVPSSPAAERMFVCKTCNRRFLSFQALGGHRASHKKLRAGAVGETEMGNPKVHECSVCGLEFAVGQALGGHMRRHRTLAAAAAAAEQEEGEKVGGGEGRRVMWMDLNLTPTENDLVMRKMGGIGIGAGDLIAVVDCFH